MEWLTEYKIPVGKVAKAVFTWMNYNLGWLFDGISAVMESMIDGILWLLQTPHPFVIIGLFVAMTWGLQRNWKVCLGVLLGFLFILNQGYWEETTESLTLILSACVVCMGLGVPIGIAAAHRPRLYTAMVPVLDLMQTLPTFVYLIPAIVFFRPWHGAGLDCDGDFRAARADPADPPWRLLDPDGALGGRNRLWRDAEAAALEGRACRGPCRRSWRGLNQTIMLSLVDGGHRGPCRRERSGRARGARPEFSVNTALGFESGFIIVVVAILLDRMPEGVPNMSRAAVEFDQVSASSSATTPTAPCR